MSDTVSMTMREPARRVEIFTGAGRRRSWNSEEKASIVAESLTGRESVSAVARRHGLTPAQLFGWRRQCGSVPTSERLRFASVVIGASAIEIELGGATIRVPAGVDAATLRVVLEAMKAMA